MTYSAYAVTILGGEIGGAVSYNFKFVVTPRPAAAGTSLPFRRILSETAVA